MKPSLLRQGSTGLEVVTAQNALTKAGFYVVADGNFGPLTRAATRLFQRKHGLADDGLIGSATWEALFKATADAPKPQGVPAIGGGKVQQIANTPAPKPVKAAPVIEKSSATADLKLIQNHWFASAIREPIEGGSDLVPLFLVIHFTAGATAKSSINFWRTPAAKGASAQIVIDRDGTIYQCRPFNKTCGHAGKSTWKGHNGLNDCSIGIELANAGDDEKLAARYTTLPLVEAKHKNGGPVTKWEAYTEAQLKSLEILAKALVKEYGITEIVGHDDIAPKRKNDPGPAFPMDEFRKTVFDA